MRSAGRVFLVVFLAACGADGPPAVPSAPPTTDDPSATPRADAERWSGGTYSILVPGGWTLDEEPDEAGLRTIHAPSGDGEIVFREVVDNDPPDVIDEEYMRARSTSIGQSVFTTAVRVTLHDPPGFGSYFTTAEAVDDEGFTALAIHAWQPGRFVVVAYFSSDGGDAHQATARRILRSVKPEPEA
jgi:hypothetical protein